MIQDIAPHRYDKTFAPAAPAQSSPVLCFREGQVLLRRTASGVLALPCLGDLPALAVPPRFAFRLDGAAYFLALAPVEAPAEDFYFAPQASLRQAEPQHLAFACAVLACMIFLLPQWTSRPDQTYPPTSQDNGDLGMVSSPSHPL